MHKKAFISISYKNKDTLSSEIQIISTTLQQLHIEPVVFVQKYSFTPTQEKEMMKKAIEEIQSCDLLIAEVSEKAIGVGIEIGYARGLEKPIIYIRKEDADYSTTVGGLSDHQIVYGNLEQLRTTLIETIKNVSFPKTKRPSVGVAVIVQKGKQILLGKRKGSHGTGSWNFPGGHLEFGESIEDCAIREVREEAGIEITTIHYDTYTNDFFHDEQKHYVTLFVTSEYKSGDARVNEPEKCDQWGWFTWDHLPEPLFLPIRNLLRQRLKRP